MLTRRHTLSILTFSGMFGFARKTFANPEQPLDTYILPFNPKTIYVRPGEKKLVITIPLQLVYNYGARNNKVTVPGLEIHTNKAVSTTVLSNKLTRKNIKVSPSLVYTDQNGFANWKATIPLSGLADKADENIVVSPFFLGKGNLAPSPILSTVNLYIRYRK